MIKKIALPMIIISMVIQLLVPVGMIAYSQKTEEQILENGVQYEMDISVKSICDNKVTFSPDYYITRSLKKGWDVVLEEDENGRMVKGLGSPYKSYKGDEPYIKATRRNIKALSEYEIEYDGETIYTLESAYIKFVLYNGNVVITELYIDGKPAEVFVEEYDTSVFDDEINFDEIVWEEETLSDE